MRQFLMHIVFNSRFCQAPPANGNDTKEKRQSKLIDYHPKIPTLYDQPVSLLLLLSYILMRT